MADGITTNHGFTLPEVGLSKATWGTKLNNNWSALDAILNTTTGLFLARAGGTMVGQISLPNAPTVDAHAARKRYVDDQVATRLTQAAADARYLQPAAAASTYLSKGGDTMSGRLRTSVSAPIDANEMTRKDYVDNAVATRLTQTQGDARYVNLSGGYTSSQTIEGRVYIRGESGGSVLRLYAADGASVANVKADGSIDVGNYVSSGALPSSDTHLTRKDYVDDAVATRMTQAASDARYLRLAGGTMTGHIEMKNYVVYADTDSGSTRAYTRKSYVDNAVAGRLTQSAADGRYALRGRSMAAGNGLTGGGDYTADRTITLGTPSSITADSENAVGRETHSHYISSTTVGILYAGLAPSSRGSIIFARNGSGSTRAAGQTVSGSQLFYAGVNGEFTYTNGSPDTGTWECMGYAPHLAFSNWRRIS